MNWAVLGAAVWLGLFPLNANTVVVRDAAPRMLLWSIGGLENPKGLMAVRVQPTQLGLVLGLDVKSIHVRPVATREDQTPHLILPVKTERRDHALQAVFNPVGRRFFLIVTLRDGTTETIDPIGPPAADKFRTMPLDEIAGQIKRG